MAQEIHCPHCGQTYSIPTDQEGQYTGQTIECTKCHQRFTVNFPAQAGAPMPPVFQGQSVGYATPSAPQRISRMAIVSLVLGCIGMSLCMFAVLLPSLNTPRDIHYSRDKCASNMRQIGQAMMLYANENKGHYPPTPDLLVLTQDIGTEVFICPSTSDTRGTGATTQAMAASILTSGHNSYVYLGKGLKLESPPSMILLYEPLTNHSGDGANFVFGDGTVKYLSKREAQAVINGLNAGRNPPTTNALR